MLWVQATSTTKALSSPPGPCPLQTIEGSQHFQSFSSVCVQTLLIWMLAWKSCKISWENPEHILALDMTSMFWFSWLPPNQVVQRGCRKPSFPNSFQIWVEQKPELSQSDVTLSSLQLILFLLRVYKCSGTLFVLNNQKTMSSIPLRWVENPKLSLILQTPLYGNQDFSPCDEPYISGPVMSYFTRTFCFSWEKSYFLMRKSFKIKCPSGMLFEEVKRFTCKDRCNNTMRIF